MSWAEITNPYLKTRPQEKDVDGNWIDKQKPRITQHTASDEMVVMNPNHDFDVFNSFGKKTIIHSLTYLTNTTVFPRLETSHTNPIIYTTQLLHSISNITGRRIPGAPYAIENSEHEYLEILSKSDDADPLYLITLKKPIELPEGCIFNFRTSSLGLETGGILTYKMYWTEEEG